MRWDDLRAAWEEDEDFLEAYRSEYPHHAVADAVVNLRKELRLTQQELADRAATSQSVIARLESGKHGANMDLLNQIANGVGRTWRPEFVPLRPAASCGAIPSRRDPELAGRG